jgi:hypothetical protein
MRIVLTLAVLGVLMGTGDAQKNWQMPVQQEVDYASWTKLHAGTPFKSSFPDAYPDGNVWFTVLSTECEGETTASSRHGTCRLPTNTAQVSSTGFVAHLHTTCCPGAGGGVGKLKIGTIEQLRALVPKLPDDGGRLPGLGRRLLIQVINQGSIKVRVYDEEKLPDIVQKIVNVVGLTILHQQIPARQ